MYNKAEHSLIKLRNWCEKEGFKGYDPFDGLNSQFFKSLPVFPENRIARLAWIQMFKRLPFNIRPLLGVQKGLNPKGLGLFLSGYCILNRLSNSHDISDIQVQLGAKLISNVSKGYSGACWGYNFDWQSKAFFQPESTPTVVATSFIGNAFLDFYESSGDKTHLGIARSACDFILNDLYRTEDEKGNFAFSYSPLDKSVVYNATLLGSRLLARVYSFTGEENLIREAQKSVAYCCDRQSSDGSWRYGSANIHKWIDSFHTGFNLESIHDYERYSGDTSYHENLEKGFEFYLASFFTDTGLPKYYNESTYPIDLHSTAQLVSTLSKSGRFAENRGLVDKVVSWAIDNMQSEEGYFFYQKKRFITIRIPYMRWTQAWMFYALSLYLHEHKNSEWKIEISIQ